MLVAHHNNIREFHCFASLNLLLFIFLGVHFTEKIINTEPVLGPGCAHLLSSHIYSQKHGYMEILLQLSLFYQIIQPNKKIGEENKFTGLQSSFILLLQTTRLAH